MTTKSKKAPPPIVWVFLAALLFLANKFVFKIGTPDRGQVSKLEQNSNAKSDRKLNLKADAVSWGNKFLITANINSQKQQGIAAFNQQNYQEAAEYWQAALKRSPNDPETLIYLNNALIGNKQSYSLAVSVPIGVDPNTAQEILRGVAQAQQEINAVGGINGIPLKIAIADDSNNPQVAQKLAQKLAENSDILGVIGHFSSDVTLAAASTYESADLVAISPTSTSVSISNAGDYIFRTVPSDRFAGNALAEHLLERLNKQNAAIFYNSQSDYSNSLKDAFSTDLISNGGRIITEFDLGDSNFDPELAIAKAEENGAEALIVLADSSTLDSALSVARANNLQLPLLAGDSVYTAKTLQAAGQDTVGMVVAIPWHIRGAVDSDYPQAATRLWKAEVNWRSALAYDATQALIRGLEIEPTLQGIQTALAEPQFSLIGASGEINFLPSGDRNQKPQLVEVQSRNRSGFGYDFVPIN